MEDVTVTISGKWHRHANSWVLQLVAALTGVSVSFAPMFLFLLGRDKAEFWNPWVLLCFAVIYFVPGFYMTLALQVLKQLVKQPPKHGASSAQIEQQTIDE